MHRTFTTTAVTVALTALTIIAPAAQASGGKAAGGGATSSTITSTATTPNAGGGGGGGQRRGSADSSTTTTVVIPPPPAPATFSCAAMSSASATVGYYLTWAALWNNFSFRNCADGQETVTISITNTDRATGLVAYGANASYSLSSGQNMSGVFDNDFAAFSTDYDVQYTLRDASGATLDSWSGLATTPAPR